MKKNRLNLSTVIGILLIALAFVIAMTSKTVFATSYNFNVESQTEEFYVNDFAGVFSEEQKKQIMENAVELDSTYDGIQVVVTTINSLNGHEIEQYAKTMYDQYGIGKDSMGILILLSVGDRDVRIETGNQMQLYITDSMSGRLLDDYGMEHFKNNEFAQGLIDVQSATISTIYEKVPKDWVNQSTERADLDINLWPFFTWFIGIVTFIGSGFGISKLIKKIKKKRKAKKDAQIAKIQQDRDEEWEKKVRGIQRSHEKEISDLQNSIFLKDTDISNYKEQNEELLNKVKSLEENISYTKAIHPNIDQEIADYIEDGYKREALDLDERIKSVLKKKPTKDNGKTYDSIIKEYNDISPFVRKYVTSDIGNVESKLREANHLKDIAIATGVSALVVALCKKNSSGNHQNYEEIHKVYSKYTKLTESQKSVFPEKALVSKLSSMYKSAKADYSNFTSAKEVETNMQGVVDSVGSSADRDDISKLKNAKSKYDALNTFQTKYISYTLYEKILRLLREAEDDEEDYKRRKRQEEEERRRRIQRSTSFSSSSHRSSFGGHGGHSGGGGASRHF